jgi:serine protease AprX
LDDKDSASGAGAAPTPDHQPVRFDPERLDRTMIAIELLAKLAEAAQGEVVDIIIDLNLEYPSGRDAARDWVRSWLSRRLAKRDEPVPASPAPTTPAPGESVNDAKSLYSQQYVFAALTPEGVRQLVVDLKGAPQGDGTEKKRTRKPGQSPVYKIWLDHDLRPFMNVSIVTVKADAARAAFSADGQAIVWAVADSGIDGTHPHFARHGNLEGLNGPVRHRDFTREGKVSDAQLEKSAREDIFGHGTHVAGIIAGEVPPDPPVPSGAKGRKKNHGQELTVETAPAVAFRRERDEGGAISTSAEPLSKMSGMAPCCKLLSLKVLGPDGRGKASNLIAAIEYIQHLNGNGRRIRVHGLNISVGYPYEPEWFACGQSPLCVEIDRLVKSGVCVVVAAGNDGYGFVNSKSAGTAAAGLDVTIADPGNADLAITVGSTHREAPHTYGVSYFSSKGPTGDGRLKPDVLAPGEKILSCMSAQMAVQTAKLAKPAVDDAIARARKGAALYREDSGTSMAAPHVSGVIAAFLSNRREFIGRPEAVKDVFLATATDLKRSTYFQGKGVVDLMRAIQSI